MKLTELLEIASEGYPDKALEQYFDADEDRVFDKDNDGGRLGDTLALFIVRELKDVYDSAASDLDQLQTAMDALGKAENELGCCYTELMRARDKLLRDKRTVDAQ